MADSWNAYRWNYERLNVMSLTKDPVKTKSKFESLAMQDTVDDAPSQSTEVEHMFRDHKHI